MQPLKLIILSTVTFMQHSTSDNVAMFHVKHPPLPLTRIVFTRVFREGGPVDRQAYMGGRAREPSGVDHGLRAGGPSNRQA
jgi:hypothetical protein